MITQDGHGKVGMTITIPEELVPAVSTILFDGIAGRLKLEYSLNDNDFNDMAEALMADKLVDWYCSNIGLSAKGLRKLQKEVKNNETV